MIEDSISKVLSERAVACTRFKKGPMPEAASDIPEPETAPAGHSPVEPVPPTPLESGATSAPPGQEVVPTMPPTGAPEVSSASIDFEQERKNREAFEQAKKEFDENEEKIAQTRYKAKSRWQVIKETLGFNQKMIEDDTIKAFVDQRKGLYQKLMGSGRKALSGNEQEYEEFMNRYDLETIAINSRVLETDIRAQNAKWPTKALTGFMRLSGFYRTFISKQFLNEKGKLSFKGIAKGTAIAASISLALATALGVALPAIGVAAIGAGTLSAWSMRIFGGVGVGYVAKKRMEAGFLESKKKEIEERVKRKIEDMKNKTDEDWNRMVEGMMLETTIEDKEQDFAEVDARHKKLALALAGGTITASWLVSHFVAPHVKGLFGQAWDKVTHLFGGGKTGFYDAHGPVAITEMPKGPSHAPETNGKGAVVPEKTGKPFLGDTQIIDKKNNNCVWKATRNLYLKHHGEYEYDPNDPKTNLKLRKLFRSLKDQGFLRRMGIKAHNFDSLSDQDKMKIWAENKAANTMDWYKKFHGGRLPKIVHEHDMVTLDNKGRLFFGDTSNIRTGYSHDVSSAHGAGRVAAESYAGRGGGAGQVVAEASTPGGAGRAVADNYPRGRVAESIADQRIRAADEWQVRAKANYENVVSGNAKNLAGARAVAAAAEAKSVAMDSAQTHKWMDYIQEGIYGKGTIIDWQQSAREFRNKFMGSFISSDQHIPPANVGEQQGFWRAAQELNKKLGLPIGNESVEQWLARGLDQGRISSEDAMRVFDRVVNA